MTINRCLWVEYIFKKESTPLFQKRAEKEEGVARVYGPPVPICKHNWTLGTQLPLKTFKSCCFGFTAMMFEFSCHWHSVLAGYLIFKNVNKTEKQLLVLKVIWIHYIKGQLISKQNFRAVTSPSALRIVSWSWVRFVHFLGEVTARKFRLRSTNLYLS